MATKKAKTAAKRITTNTSCVKVGGNGEHRAGVWNCPHCDHAPSGSGGDGMKWWYENGHTLVIAVIWGKHDSAVVITECPSCFENSWMHISLNYNSWMNLPKDWVEALEEECLKRKVAAAKACTGALCLNCKKLDSIDVSTHAWRGCSKGSGPLETECDEYEESE